jgi:hypothetical protein
MSTPLGKLEKVDLRTQWKGEAGEFTPWLANEENICLLGEEIGIELEVLQQEERVGPFRADILCKDINTSRNVLIENQLERTDHNHLGQILTYAAGLDAVTVIWISKIFTDEHRAALDWLNRITGDDINFFGIEIELYKIGTSLSAPKFNVVSKPNDWSKNIKRSADNIHLTETQLKQQEYWQALKDFVESKKSNYKMQKPSPQHWSNVSVGRSNFHISALINSRDKWIGIQLNISGPNALDNFRNLRELYEQDSKTNLDPKIEWAEKNGGKEHHVNLILLNTNPFEKTDWQRQHIWLKDEIGKFVLYFKDKIKEL